MPGEFTSPEQMKMDMGTRRGLPRWERPELILPN